MWSTWISSQQILCSNSSQNTVVNTWFFLCALASYWIISLQFFQVLKSPRKWDRGISCHSQDTYRWITIIKKCKFMYSDDIPSIAQCDILCSQRSALSQLCVHPLPKFVCRLTAEFKCNIKNNMVGKAPINRIRSLAAIMIPWPRFTHHPLPKTIYNCTLAYHFQNELQSQHYTIQSLENNFFPVLGDAWNLSVVTPTLHIHIKFNQLNQKLAVKLWCIDESQIRKASLFANLVLHWS